MTVQIGRSFCSCWQCIEHSAFQTLHLFVWFRVYEILVPLQEVKILHHVLRQFADGFVGDNIPHHRHLLFETPIRGKSEELFFVHPQSFHDTEHIRNHRFSFLELVRDQTKKSSYIIPLLTSGKLSPLFCIHPLRAIAIAL